MIAEDAIARARKELYDAIDLWLVSDNACTYQNDLLPVMGPSIARAHDFRLFGFLHRRRRERRVLSMPIFQLMCGKCIDMSKKRSQVS